MKRKMKRKSWTKKMKMMTRKKMILVCIIVTDEDYNIFINLLCYVNS